MSSLFQLEHLTHDYGQHRALDDVNLDIAPGTIGLVGQNGAGKSTLMQILLGLNRPTQGVARLFGQDVQQAGVELRGRVGFMPERSAIIPGLHGLEYVALAGELSGMPRREAMRRGHETLSYLGLEEARYRKLEQYSVGMQQRLKLAATLVHDPDLLLLDEPTAGLDPDGRNKMLSLIRGLASRPDKSLVLSSHLLGDIERVCETTIILDAGRVIGVGPMDDLRSSRPSCYTLRWKGEADGFLDGLREVGVQLEAVDKTSARVTLPDGKTTQLIFALAHRHSISLTALEPEEENLEAVYHRLIGRQDNLNEVRSDRATPVGQEAAS
jgi:ABC-2 type transport system ATP-binding protein